MYMSRKSVDDYLIDGIYGAKRPKEAEREKYLGTLRERIVIVLTKGQVMTDNSIKQLEEAIQEYPDSRLLVNGDIAYRFSQKEKAIANKYNIPITVVSNEGTDTDIGAILTYDYAIDKKDIFIKQEEEEKKEDPESESNPSLFAKIKSWFT